MNTRPKTEDAGNRKADGISRRTLLATSTVGAGAVGAHCARRPVRRLDDEPFDP